MQNKIEYFEPGGERLDVSAERRCLRARLEQHLRSSARDAVVTPVAAGTLGLCYQVEMFGKPRFLKTHLPNAKARASLAKEADILARLYGSGFLLDRFDMTAMDGTARLCVLMPALQPLAAPMESEQVAAMTRDYRRRLEGYRPESLASSWDFDQYLARAREALSTLSDRGLLEKASASDVGRLISYLEDGISGQPRVLCHGDFGPRNIMLSETRPLAIDWEDAFWGIAGYDYLYWLTFMENRPLLRTAAFGKTELEARTEHAILALVVVLKCYLAVRSGAYLAHSVPIQMRIDEIVDLRTRQ